MLLTHAENELYKFTSNTNYKNTSYTKLYKYHWTNVTRNAMVQLSHLCWDASTPHYIMWQIKSKDMNKNKNKLQQWDSINQYFQLLLNWHTFPQLLQLRPITRVNFWELFEQTLLHAGCLSCSTNATFNHANEKWVQMLLNVPILAKHQHKYTHICIVFYTYFTTHYQQFLQSKIPTKQVGLSFTEPTSLTALFTR